MEHRTCVSALYLGCPELRERERITLCDATVTPYTHMPPPLFPWPHAAAEERCKSRAQKGSGCNRESLAGYSFWVAALAICRVCNRARCWRAAPGLEIAACSRLPPHQAPTQPLAPCLQVLLVGGLHLSSHTFPPYLHMGSPRSARGSSVPPVWQWFCCGLRCAQLATTRAAPRQSKNKVQQFLHCRGRPGQGVAACLLSFMLNCSQSTVLI